ncbi:porin family protein [Carboxylicivirga sp. N1Y90]|uniref:porin family protein n=1 Tax=Carboxylicivirga fragile TaxID=3417571 RepID=UPI003D348867|nr:PorT family protein [Marinilabiliaceae bacterium N1Y90]
MNKLLVIIASLLITVITCEAQEFRAGPLAGIGFSQVDGDAFAGYQKIGLNIGGFVSRSIAKDWDLQLDIAYIQKGSKVTPDVEKGKYDEYEIDLHYINFPLVARYQYKQFSFEGGLAIAVLFADDEIQNGQSIKGNDGVPPFQTIEYSTVFGVNYHFSERLWVNARMLYSLNRIRIPYNGEIPIYDPKPHWLSRKPGQYNNNIVFSMYYAI